MRLTTISLALLPLTLAGCFGSTASPAASPYPPPAAYQNPAFSHSAAELETFLQRTLQGYAPEGTPIPGQLEAFAPVPFRAERGKCYMMVLRLGSGATFSDHARKGVGFNYTPTGGGAEISGGPGIHGPGGAGSGGCPQASGELVFDLQAYSGSATDKSRIHDLGQGSYTLQLHSKPVTEEGLAAQQADRERQIAESEEFRRQEEAKKAQRIQSGCARCAQQHQECIADWRRGASRQTCTNEYRSCVFRETMLPGPEQCPR